MADDTRHDDRDSTNDRTTAASASAPQPVAATDDDGESRLSRLDDYEVEDGYPDIRGWPVRGSNGRELGVVGDLLVDTRLLEVAALEVHLGVGAAGVRGNVVGSARVPIEAVQLRRDRYVVVDIEMIPCDDVLAVVTDTSGETRRVPCGQIGIRRRGESTQAAGAATHDVEVPRPAAVVDSGAPDAAPRSSDGGGPPRVADADLRSE